MMDMDEVIESIAKSEWERIREAIGSVSWDCLPEEQRNQDRDHVRRVIVSYLDHVLADITKGRTT